MTRFLTALGNEVRKGLLSAWSERLQIALELPFFIVFILLLGPMLGSGRQIAAGHLTWTLNSSRISLIETLVLMGVTYGLVSAFVTLHFHWTAAALVPVAFLILTGIGYSLIIAGLTLLWKRIQLLQETMLLLVMVFAISALPVLTVPGWFTGIGRVFPVTSSVASLYGVMLGHRGVTGAWGTGGLVWVAVTAAAYLAAGLVVFRALEHVTKRRGALAAY